jgi:hypothetical protein
VTRTIEGSAGLLSTENAAKKLLRGIDQCHYHITADLLSSFVRMSMNGKERKNSVEKT